MRMAGVDEHMLLRACRGRWLGAVRVKHFFFDGGDAGGVGGLLRCFTVKEIINVLWKRGMLD